MPLAQIGLSFDPIGFLYGLAEFGLLAAAVLAGLLGVFLAARAFRRPMAPLAPPLWLGCVAASLGVLFTAHQTLSFKEGGNEVFLVPALAAVLCGLLALGVGLRAARRRAPSHPWRGVAAVFVLLLLAEIGLRIESHRRYRRYRLWAESFMRYGQSEDCEPFVSFAVCAAARGDLEAVERFLAYHPEDVRAFGADGLTPLHHAAAHGDRPMVLLLLSRGANLEARSAEGLKPAEMASRRGHPELAPLLQK